MTSQIHSPLLRPGGGCSTGGSSRCGLLPCFGAGGVCNATDGRCSFMIYKASFSIPIYLSPGKLPNGKVLVCHLAQTRLAAARLTPTRCYRSHCTNSRRCPRPAKLPRLGTFSRLIVLAEGYKAFVSFGSCASRRDWLLIC